MAPTAWTVNALASTVIGELFPLIWNKLGRNGFSSDGGNGPDRIEVGVSGETDVRSLSREDLEAEVQRLRRQVRVAPNAAAEASERQRRAIIESAVDFAIIATGTDGRVIEWNTGAARILGWSAEEMKGETIDRIFTAEDRDTAQLEREMRSALESGRGSDERWHLRKNGERFWASGEMMPLRDAAGGHAGFVKIVRDRTDAHLAGTALRDSEALLRRAQEAGGIGLFWIGVDDDLLHASREFCRLFGLPERETFPTRAIEDAVIAEDAALVSTTEKRRSGAVIPDVEYRIRRGDTQEERWIWRRAEIEHDERGRPRRIVGVARDVTDQVRARRQLEDQREQLAQMFEQAPTFMALLRGPEHRIELVNPGFVRLIGGRDVVGQPLAEALPDAVEQGFLKLLDEVYRSGRSYAAVGATYAVRADPRQQPDVRFVDFVYQPIRDAAGIVSGVFIAGADVTDRKRAEAALTDSEHRYRALFDSMDEGFCVIEFFDGPHGPLSDYVHIEANAAYAKQAGIPDVVGQKLREMVPDEADGWVELYGGVLRTGEPIRFERELVATRRYLELAAFRIEPASRRQVAVLFQDITARKRAEKALRELNETLEARVAAALAERKVLADVVEGTDALVQVVDPQYRWLAINGAAAHDFERFFGVLPKVGDCMLELLAHQPEQRAAVHAVWARALAGEEFVEIAPVGDAQRGARHHEMRFGTLRDAGGRQIGAYQFVYDVTERLAEQDRLRKAEEALRQSQKMEAVGQLTGGIAHDFNNLLTGISGSLELLQVRLSQGRLTEIDRYVAAAQGASKRAAALTHRLLAFSRRQTLDPKPTDLNRLVIGMDELIRRTIGPQITLEVATAGGLWSTLIDPPQLENALLNLCINARDAMPEGGRITIETANKWFDQRAARERDLPPGQYVSLCVTDTGVGMTADVIAKAFDPFFTTKPIGQGTGLGLSMIYGFVRQSGGQVRIYSEVAQGTTMCLYLPRHHISESDVDPMGDLAETPRAAHGETVLVVDDEPTVRMLVTEVLEDLGYAAIEAADGPAGLKVLHSDARIDLLITDVGLPGGMNGRQMADAARQRRPDLKVLFITGYAENSVIGNGHLAPGMQVMTKPFVVEVLANRIRELIET